MLIFTAIVMETALVPHSSGLFSSSLCIVTSVLHDFSVALGFCAIRINLLSNSKFALISCFLFQQCCICCKCPFFSLKCHIWSYYHWITCRLLLLECHHVCKQHCCVWITKKNLINTMRGWNHDCVPAPSSVCLPWGLVVCWVEAQ